MLSTKQSFQIVTKVISRRYRISLVLFTVASFLIFKHKDSPLFAKLFESSGQNELIFGLSAGIIAVYIFLGTSFSLSFDKTIHGEKYLGEPVFSFSLSDKPSVIFTSNPLFKQLFYILFITPFILPITSSITPYIISAWASSFLTLAIVALSASTQIINQHSIGLRNSSYHKWKIEEKIEKEFLKNITYVVKSSKDFSYSSKRLASIFISNLRELPQQEWLRYIELTVFNNNHYIQHRTSKNYYNLIQEIHYGILEFFSSNQNLQAIETKQTIFKLLERELALLRHHDKNVAPLTDKYTRFGARRSFDAKSSEISYDIPYNLNQRYVNIFYIFSLIGDSLISYFNAYRMTASDINSIFNALETVKSSTLKNKLKLLLFKSVLLYCSQSMTDFKIDDVYALSESSRKNRLYRNHVKFRFQNQALQLLSKNLTSDVFVFKETLDFIESEAIRIKFLETVLYRNRSHRKIPDNLIETFTDYWNKRITDSDAEDSLSGEKAFNELQKTNVSHFIDKVSIEWLFSIAGNPLSIEVLDKFYLLKEEHRLQEFSLIDLIHWIRFNNNSYYTFDSGYSPKVKELPWGGSEIENIIKAFKEGNSPAGTDSEDFYILNKFLFKFKNLQNESENNS